MDWKIVASIGMVIIGMGVMRKSFWIGFASAVIGSIAVLAYADLLDTAIQVPGALVNGISTFFSSVG